MAWLVHIDKTTAVKVEADTARAAKVLAKLQAWVLTGKWVPILSVELDETEQPNQEKNRL